MAAKRTPDHLKVISGTARPDRMNPDAPQAAEGIATAPQWLSERASVLFAEVAAILDGLGLSSPVDVFALAMLASRLEEVEICTAVIEDAGRTYSTTATSGDKLMRARPEVAMKNEAMRHAQSLLAEFGLTPAARSKVSAGKNAGENPFAALDRS